MYKAQGQDMSTPALRKGAGFFDFPECLKDTEWLQFLKPCVEDRRQIPTITRAKSEKSKRRKKKDRIILNDEEEVEEEEESVTPGQEDEDAVWEALRESGFLEHVDENDAEFIAKNKAIQAMNKFKLHEIKKQHWDIRKALDGTRPITRQEVAFHCDNGDILLIRNRRVINAMNIEISHINEHQDKLLPLITMKGQDISHWFNPITGEPRTKIDLKTGKKVLYTPDGFYYGLGPIRRQRELEQETAANSSIKSPSALVDLHEGHSHAESQVKEYNTYVTDNYADDDVSGFSPTIRRSVFSDTQDNVDDMDVEDEEVAEEQSIENAEGELERESETEIDVDEEEDSEEMDENVGTIKHKKSLGMDETVGTTRHKSLGMDEAVGTTRHKSLGMDDSVGTTSDRKSVKSLGSVEGIDEVETTSNANPSISQKEIKSHSNESIPANTSDPSMIIDDSKKDEDKSNPNVSTSIPAVKSSGSGTKVKSESRKSIKESTDVDIDGIPLRKSSKSEDHKSDSTSEHEDNSGETDSKSNSNSPPHTMSKESKRSIHRSSKVTDISSQEEENMIQESEGESDEDLEDVFSHRSSTHSAYSVFTNAEGSNFGPTMSTIPQMGSEHSLLSEASVYSKTTVDTTANASTVYGVQTDVFPGLSWTNHDDPDYEEKWWLETKYLCGYIPRSTISIRIINSLSYDERVLVISKEYTINDIMRYYLPYNHNAMGYRWEDMFGNVLHPDRTVVENGLIDMELAEDNGFNCYPVIILVYIDGFEDEPIISLNPKELAKQMVVTSICRNY